MVTRLILILLCLPAVVSAQSQPAPPNVLKQLDEAIVRLAEQMAPAVVQVLSKGYRPAVSQGGGPPAVAMREGTGSGLILSTDGYIVTNAHVVEGATHVEVQLAFVDAPAGKSVVRPRGKLFPARVVGKDDESDLALLKVEGTNLPFLRLADSEKIRQGQLVLALGSPLGLENSISMGVISSVARQLSPDDRMIYLQTDAPINPGNSGGPLIDVHGNVIGINTMIFSQSGGSEGLGFAVPSNIVQSVVEQLRAHGSFSRGDIGVEAITITPSLARALELERDHGVLLSEVYPGSPADLSDLHIDDIVLSLNDKPMENARQFHVNIYGAAVDTRVTIEVLRGAEKLTRTVPVRARPSMPERLAGIVDREQTLIARLGILAVAIDSEISKVLPMLRKPNGILVTSLVVSPTAPTGVFLPGDVIYSINTTPVSTPDELRFLLERFRPGDVIVLQVERAGTMQYVELPLS